MFDSSAVQGAPSNSVMAAPRAEGIRRGSWRFTNRRMTPGDAIHLARGLSRHVLHVLADRGPASSLQELQIIRNGRQGIVDGMAEGHGQLAGSQPPLHPGQFVLQAANPEAHPAAP